VTKDSLADILKKIELAALKGNYERVNKLMTILEVYI